MRAVRRKRPPFLTAKRIGWLSGLVVAGVLLALFFLFRSAQAPDWEQQEQAEKAAAEAAQLTKVTSAYKHIWDGVVWTIEGETAEGVKLIVWVPEEGEPQWLQASQVIPKSQVRRSLLQSKPDAEIIRIELGLLNGEKIWEIYYSRQEDMTKHYYDFYRVTDGSYITTYKLTGRFGT
ncbi:DUF5590 domain-containing protein [Paenibacillus sp. GCM10023252]|uniref:cell wall elongation regulator TseB-like domain-containing protein n=1 Tax=Paenibacillus sp. GCM10023252 TaxID=3252649 RepID=UPI00362259BE